MNPIIEPIAIEPIEKLLDKLNGYAITNPLKQPSETEQLLKKLDEEDLDEFGKQMLKDIGEEGQVTPDIELEYNDKELNPVLSQSIELNLKRFPDVVFRLVWTENLEYEQQEYELIRQYITFSYSIAKNATTDGELCYFEYHPV